MEFLLHFPAYAKVGISFLGILIAYRCRVSLGYAILLFAIILTAWTETGMLGFVHQIKTLFSPESYLLLLVILLLLFFTGALNKTGKMKRTIDALSLWLKSPKFLLVVFPVLVGLLPMPGGALFSAPLVDAVDKDNKVKPAHKAAINYWFRHIWEYWWPLYPGIILAIKYSGLSAGLFFLIQMPFTVAAFTGGYLYIMKGMGKDSKRHSLGKLDFRALAATLWPIGILVGFSLAGSFLLPTFGISKTLSNLFGMVFGLLIGLCVIFWHTHGSFVKSLMMLTNKNTWDLMLLVIGIQVFSAALSVPLVGGDHGTLVSGMRDEFLQKGIPLLLVIALIPFISGAVTGVAFGFVGASFPLVFALLGTSPPLNVVLAATTFAYGCGYVGMILSPVHICFVVTNEYFKVKMTETYRYILVPTGIVLFSGCVMSGAYYLFVK